MSRNLKGFTLIELLIVIAAIGLLSSIVVVLLNGARIKSRDSRRVAYVKQITDALELYYLHNGIYPTVITTGQKLSVGNTLYLNPVPSNPAPRNDVACPNSDFSYKTNSNNSAYNLRFCLGGASGAFNAGINVCSQGSSCNSIQPDTVSGLILWLKADWLNLNDGDTVAKWYDLSSYSNDASAPSAGNRPIFKTGVLNGKPVLRFNGSSSLLNLTSNVTTARTIMMVYEWDSQVIAASYAPILGSTATYYDLHGMTEAGSPTDKVFGTAWASTYIANASVWENGASTTAANLTKNRTSFSLIEVQTTGNVRFNNISNDRSIAGRYFHGDIAEIIVYDSVLSTSDRQKVERYLRDKYSLSISGL